MSLLALLQTGCLAAFAILLLVAGWQDLRTLRIANHLSLATIAAFALWAAAGIALWWILAPDTRFAGPLLWALGGLACIAGASAWNPQPRGPARADASDPKRGPMASLTTGSSHRSP